MNAAMTLGLQEQNAARSDERYGPRLQSSLPISCLCSPLHIYFISHCGSALSSFWSTWQKMTATPSLDCISFHSKFLREGTHQISLGQVSPLDELPMVIKVTLKAQGNCNHIVGREEEQFSEKGLLGRQISRNSLERLKI